MAFIVRVLRGVRPAHRAKVRVGFTSAFGGMSLLGYTDTSGCAIFESPEQGMAEVRVEGVSYGLYDYNGDGSVTLNLDWEADELEE
jgi:hypothetical protein